MSLDLTTLRRRLQKALGKKFTVGNVLGEGGFAAVFRVRDDTLGHDVAVKVLDLGLTPSPGLAERFVREARTSAGLEHPHIVPIYKVGGYKNEVLYIVMRCFDGESAQSVLMKQATATAEPIRHLRSEIPATLAAVVDRALAKDPAERFQTAEELSRALVEALPTAAHDTVGGRPSLAAGAIRALAGLGVVTGVVLVMLTILSRPPRVSALAPLPDSVADVIRSLSALTPGDRALYVFSPHGPDDTTVLVVARRSIAVATPHGVRAYPRDDVQAQYGATIRAGLSFRMVPALPRARRDTVFYQLSVRGVHALARRLGQL